MPFLETSGPRQHSDGRADGQIFGLAPTDRISFFGANPVVRASGAIQATLTRGLAAGVIATYSTTQSPSAVTANTTGERSMTVQTGTGATMLVAAGDLLYVNKPTAQAGLGVGNARISASNTVQVTFSNFTGGSITPTASEAYRIVAIRGLPSISATLSPAQVAANATVEQQFAVTGLAAGGLVQVSKPTSQAGLDIVGVRVVSEGVLGITFANVTASPITPTAAEVYTISVVFGLDAANNDIWAQMNAGTVGAIGAGVVATGGSTAFTGVLATDAVTGWYKPTSQAAATNAATLAGAVATADTLTAYFAGIGTGLTPTAAEVYQFRLSRIAPAAPLVLYTPSIAPGSVAANTTAEQTFTVTGLVAGSPVWINKPSYTVGIGIVGVRVSAVNTLAITFSNSTSGAITPPTETYVVGNFQVPSPGAGNCVYQTVSRANDAQSNLLSAMRNAFVNYGLLAGA
jgi:hypothetical protein